MPGNLPQQPGVIYFKVYSIRAQRLAPHLRRAAEQRQVLAPVGRCSSSKGARGSSKRSSIALSTG